MKKKEFVCYLCGKRINKEDNYAELNSYYKKKITNSDKFHPKCWIEWLKRNAIGRINKSIEMITGYTIK